MQRSQRGISLTGAIVGMIVLAFAGLFTAKLMPAYLEYFSVQKMFKAMDQNGETKGTVAEIRKAYDRRNAIEDVKSVNAPDLEITKEGGEAVVTANWSVKIPMVYNISACLDFTVTTAK